MLYRKLLRPVLFRLSPETAHEFAVRSLALVLNSRTMRGAARRRLCVEPFGELRRFGLNFRNPVGLAAGFDKNGVAIGPLAALGFGFVEVGTVTRHAQPGNPRPRLFRLPLDRALVNRQGFNNDGAEALARRLSAAAERPCVVGVNIGKSRSAPLEAATEDYLASFEVVWPHADYITVNVSSPNTPQLRELQRPERLAALLSALQERNRELAHKADGRPLPLLVKVAPDLTPAEVETIVGVARDAGISGLIATNTTISREGLRTPAAFVAACGEGGLSGAPLRERSTRFVAALRRLAGSEMEIIGVGGIFNAADAWEKISAGAGLIQLYTGFVYEGALIARRINEGLAEILNRHGLRTLDEAVGCRTAELAVA
jgi:dihydroorotate dehydrogenase